jgi:DNA ligase (NAD+)
MSWFTNLTLDALVEQLQRANYAYHNGSGLVMGDDAYDLGLEELRRRAPSHPFLSVIGAKVPKGTKGAVVLPVILGSQDKVRSGEGGLERWMARKGGAAGVKLFVVTEKLDGLSALYVSQGSARRMYLRGDGVKGVDVSRILGRIGSIGKADCLVRGELILSSEKTPEGSIGRSLVNGWVHRSLDTTTEPPSELADVEFLAYQVMEPAGLTRSQQLKWLEKNGFKTPWSAFWPRAGITDELLKKTLIERRRASAYPLDGLVVATDTIPVGVGGGEAKNPPDSVAFKASLDEQKATTRVISIEWNQSRQGALIPRIQIEPVVISGATIQWISGHNAAFIEANKLGPGAEIVVRRSGDVIPTVDSVVKGVASWAAPPAGTWGWDERRVQAISLGAANAEKELLHALQTLEVDGIGPGLVKKMVEAGIVTMKDLWEVSEGDLAAAIGAGRAPALKKSLQERRAASSNVTLLVASNKLPRGVGEKKLRVIFDKEMDPRKWKPIMFGCDAPAGWTHSSIGGLWAPLKEALAWIDDSFPGASSALPEVKAPLVTQQPSKFVVFTNVRDHELEKLLPTAGWQIEDSVTKKTTVLVVPDSAGGELKESGKVKKARAAGIQIVPITEFRRTWNS